MTITSRENKLVTDSRAIYSGIIEDENDLANVPADAGPGSMFHTAGYKEIWEKSEDGTWVKV